MSNANKNKGKGFERQVAKILSDAFKLNFCRVPNSGAYTGGANVTRVATLTPNQQLLLTGDIIVPAELSKYAFECKFYKDFAFNTLLDENALLDGWISQAKATNKEWFLLFKINNKGIFLVLDTQKAASYVLPANKCIYKDCTVIKMDTFFTVNAQKILNCNNI